MTTLQKKSTKLLLPKIRHWVYRNKGHIAIVFVMGIYILLSPGIYAQFFIDYGKPIEFSGELPSTTDSIKYSIDSYEMVFVDTQKFQRITGWAFVANEVDQSKFEKYLVLNSDSATYTFLYEPLKRPGVQNAYHGLGIDVLYSGFDTLICGDCIKSGAYNIGFLFGDKADGTTYYSVTNQYLMRTPNHVSVTLGEKPEVNGFGKLVNEYKESLQSGKGIKFRHPLLIPTEKIIYTIENLNQVTFNENSYTRLSGWSFLAEVNYQSKYERIVTLESETGISYFPTIHLHRPDVEAAFGNNIADLSSSGFETYIITKNLPDGTYNIGLLFRDKDTGTLYYSKTKSSIVCSEGTVTLKESK